MKHIEDEEESEARAVYKEDPGVINQSDHWNRSPLVVALQHTRFQFSREYEPITPGGLGVRDRPISTERLRISRWLLSLPDLDTRSEHRNKETVNALESAIRSNYPLDIIITLLKRCSWKTVNQKDIWRLTILDKAIENGHISATLYLSWLGVRCLDENRDSYVAFDEGFYNPHYQLIHNVDSMPEGAKHSFSEVNLETWIKAERVHDAQYWAVAANDIDALESLSNMENVVLDKENLIKIAKMFDRHAICRVWGELSSSLQSLTWEEVRQSNPALATVAPDELLKREVPDHVLRVLLMYRKDESEEEVEESEEEDDSPPGPKLRPMPKVAWSNGWLEPDTDGEEWQADSDEIEDAEEAEDEDFEEVEEEGLDEEEKDLLMNMNSELNLEQLRATAVKLCISCGADTDSDSESESDMEEENETDSDLFAPESESELGTDFNSESDMEEGEEEAEDEEKELEVCV